MLKRSPLGSSFTRERTNHRMGNTQQPRISAKISGGAALMLAVVFGFGSVTTQSAQAQSLSVLYNFAGSSDGGDPYASLTRDAAGNLYSTVDYGGASFAGAVFKVAPNGTETVLYSFSSAQPRMAATSATGRCGRSRSRWDASRCGRGSELAELSTGCIRDYRYGTF